MSSGHRGQVLILGPGRAGRSLAAAFRDAGMTDVRVEGRQAAPDAFRSADVVVVTVRDGDLIGALGGLLDKDLKAGAVILHASGADDPVDALDALRRAGHPSGTFHPLVPLAEPASASALLRGAAVGVDGDPAAIAAGEELAAALGASVVRIPPGAKPRYHAAAVIASNFAVVLAASAERELRTAGIDASAAHTAVAGLLRAAVAGIIALGPERSLTGPVSRGDANTVARNLAALADDPAIQALYRAATRVAVEMARAAGAPNVDEVERATTR